MPKDTFYRLPEEKKAEIIYAALVEFAQYAFKDASINRIIKAAGIPRGSFYQYFVNKQDLYLYLLAHIAKEKVDFISSHAPFATSQTFAETYLAMVEGAVIWSKSNPLYWKIGVLMDLDDESLFSRIEESPSAVDIYRDLSRLIEQDKASGVLSPQVEGQVLMGLLTTVAVSLSRTYFLHQDQDRYLAQFKTYFSLIMAGALPR